MTIAAVVGQSMRVLETDIADIKLPEPVRHIDSRGFCSEVFRAVGWSNSQGSGQ
jgi:dTDP-4-dehydrorhamnose 3,5-epimerase-like enzyme